MKPLPSLTLLTANSRNVPVWSLKDFLYNYPGFRTGSESVRFVSNGTESSRDWTSWRKMLACGRHQIDRHGAHEDVRHLAGTCRLSDGFASGGDGGSES